MPPSPGPNNLSFLCTGTVGLISFKIPKHTLKSPFSSGRGHSWPLSLPAHRVTCLPYTVCRACANCTIIWHEEHARVENEVNFTFLHGNFQEGHVAMEAPVDGSLTKSRLEMETG